MLWTFIICLGMALLFPRGFKYLVGTFVGVCFGGFVCGLCSLFGCFHFETFTAFGQTLGAFFIIGAIIGNVFAAKG